MKEEYWAEQFSAEVDGLVHETSQIPPALAPADYRDALQLAGVLAALDFSIESRQRAILRRRLVDEARRRQEARMTTLKLRRRLALTTVGAALALTLMLALFYPGGIAAAARTLVTFIQSISLGPYTHAVQIAPGDQSGQPVPEDVWIVRTEIGNFAGNAPPGVEPLVRSLSGLQEAQSLVNFPILSPVFLPEGYALREVKLAPIGATHWVFLSYDGPGHDIILVQMPGGPQPSDNPHVMSGVFTGFLTDGTLEKAELDGQPAVWVDGHSLMWAVDNVTYEVGGLDLTIDQAKQIARSLR